MDHGVQSVLTTKAEAQHEMHLVKADLTNAHDEVTLESAGAALATRGMPAPLLNAYQRCALERSARLSALGIPTMAPLRIDRGLPQGCPASPIICAVALEEVLRDLTRPWEARGMGLHLDEETRALLAFADDDDLLADTAELASAMLNDVRETLRGASMDLQPRKWQWLAMQYVRDGDRESPSGRPCSTASRANHISWDCDVDKRCHRDGYDASYATSVGNMVAQQGGVAVLESGVCSASPALQQRHHARRALRHGDGGHTAKGQGRIVDDLLDSIVLGETDQTQERGGVGHCLPTAEGRRQEQLQLSQALPVGAGTGPAVADLSRTFGPNGQW